MRDLRLKSSHVFSRLFLAAVFFPLFSQAQFETNTTEGKYYTFSERALVTNTAHFQTPLDLFQDFAGSEESEDTWSSSNDPVNLLSWYLHEASPEKPKQNYDREKHFGSWIRDPEGTSCLNTRALVLQRDSATPVEMKASNPCTVAKGEWHDPYTGNTYTSPKDIQIDHVVPLKHTYISGGWKWTKDKRCAYGNFMKFNKHLLSVNADANMAKGDRSPQAYLPPNDSYVCEYLQNWLTVKLIWKLLVFEEEAAAIQKEFKSHGCSKSGFVFNRGELRMQRNAIPALEEACSEF